MHWMADGGCGLLVDELLAVLDDDALVGLCHALTGEVVHFCAVVQAVSRCADGTDACRLIGERKPLAA